MLGDIAREATMLQKLILNEPTRRQVSCIAFTDTALASSTALRSTEAWTNARTGADADTGTDTCADTWTESEGHQHFHTLSLPGSLTSIA